VLSLVEGRIVEVMLGERMPRRPLYQARGRSIWQRIVDMFTDPRTWSTMLYMLLLLPLGVVYFTIAVTLIAVGVAFVVAPIASWTGLGEAWFHLGDVTLIGLDGRTLQGLELVPVLLAGVLVLFATLHLARGIGRLHGLLAKHLLVKTAQYS
jgi:multidrug transporter EmrE-like cation transporter